jgi:ribosomal protein L37AE/L43A
MDDQHICVECDAAVASKRAALGYTLCLDCGDKKAKSARSSWCIAPANKSNYMLITNHAELRGLNPKRNEVG